MPERDQAQTVERDQCILRRRNAHAEDQAFCLFGMAARSNQTEWTEGCNASLLCRFTVRCAPRRRAANGGRRPPFCR